MMIQRRRIGVWQKRNFIAAGLQPAHLLELRRVMRIGRARYWQRGKEQFSHGTNLSVARTLSKCA